MPVCRSSSCHGSKYTTRLQLPDKVLNCSLFKSLFLSQVVFSDQPVLRWQTSRCRQLALVAGRAASAVGAEHGRMKPLRVMKKWVCLLIFASILLACTSLTDSIEQKDELSIATPPADESSEQNATAPTSLRAPRARKGRVIIPVGEFFLYFIVGMAIVVGSQIGLSYWRTTHPKSFERVSYCGLIVVPGVLSAVMHFWRFLIIYGIYFSVTALMGRFALQRPLAASTPRLVQAGR